MKAGADPEKIILGTIGYRKAVADLEDRSKVCMAATFLNQGRWQEWAPDDEKPELPLGGRPNGSGEEMVQTNHGKKSITFLLEKLLGHGEDFVFAQYGETALVAAKKAQQQRKRST